MRGSCLCGGVRFEVTGPAETASFCHCASCKKISGGVGTASAMVPTASIRIVSGGELITRYQPAEGSAKSFCSVCGTNLFGSGWPDAELTSVRLPALDAPHGILPERHIFVRSVAPWETLPDEGLPRFEARP